MTVEEELGSEDTEPQLREVGRGCTKESRFTCSTADNVRPCTATCKGDLCNDFDDVADRVQKYKKETSKRNKKLTIGLTVGLAAAAVLAVIIALVYRRISANRRKARDLKMGGVAKQPLNGAESG